VEILHDLMGVDVPVDAPVRLESNEFNDRPSKDLRPDTVITVGPAQSPLHGVVVEVQQKKDAGKRRQLPRYAAALWLMLQCPVTVLCVCPDAGAAAWYAEPQRTTLPGFVFRAAVLGPGEVPVIKRPEEAAEHPEWAAMAVMVHGHDRAVVETFMKGLDLMKPDYAPQYYEHALGMAAPTVRHVMEEIMASTSWPVNSRFAREHFGRGKDEGRAEGLVEGRAEGLVEGRAKGKADAVLKILAARGIEVPDVARERICGNTDAQLVDVWLERAVSANAVTDLFD
jgi:hypothetical protein